MKTIITILTLAFLSTFTSNAVEIKANPKLVTSIQKLTLIGSKLFEGKSFINFESRRGGGSFGGSRGGGSFRSSRPSGGSSFGRSSSPSARPSSPSAPRSSGMSSNNRGSFGGSRMQSGSQYTSRYGTPRKSTPMQRSNGAGGTNNYMVHNYGGYSSGLMTGYMMGASTWMWSMPFHPAFYYSRPYEVARPDGVIEVYPPTFSWGKLFFVVLLLSVIAWLVVRYFRRRNNSADYLESGSSFS